MTSAFGLARDLALVDASWSHLPRRQWARVRDQASTLISSSSVHHAASVTSHPATDRSTISAAKTAIMPHTSQPPAAGGPSDLGNFMIADTTTVAAAVAVLASLAEEGNLPRVFSRSPLRPLMPSALVTPEERRLLADCAPVVFQRSAGEEAGEEGSACSGAVGGSKSTSIRSKPLLRWAVAAPV